MAVPRLISLCPGFVRQGFFISESRPLKAKKLEERLSAGPDVQPTWPIYASALPPRCDQDHCTVSIDIVKATSGPWGCHGGRGRAASLPLLSGPPTRVEFAKSARAAPPLGCSGLGAALWPAKLCCLRPTSQFCSNSGASSKQRIALFGVQMHFRRSRNEFPAFRAARHALFLTGKAPSI